MRVLKHNVAGKYYVSIKLDDEATMKVLDPETMQHVVVGSVQEGIDQLRSAPPAKRKRGA